MKVKEFFAAGNTIVTKLPTINKADMFYCTEKVIEKVNEMFGTDIRVIENPAYKIQSMEVKDNDS